MSRLLALALFVACLPVNPPLSAAEPLWRWECASQAESPDLDAPGEAASWLTATGRAWLGVHAAFMLDGGMAEVDGEARPKVEAALQAGGPLHWEVAAIAQAAGNPRGVVVGLQASKEQPSFAIEQHGDRWVLRCGAVLDLGAVKAGQRQVLHAWRAADGSLGGAVDDQPTKAVAKGPMPVGNPRLVVGGELNAEARWHGAIEAMQLDQQVPDATALAARQQALAALWEKRPDPAPVDVTLRLVAGHETVPDDYPRILVGCIYDVVQVHRGTLAAKRIRLTQWGRLGDEIKEIIGVPAGHERRMAIVAADPKLVPVLERGVNTIDADATDEQRAGVAAQGYYALLP